MCNLENGLITNNRLILLDSYLVFFTAFSICAYTTFYKQRSVRFHHTRFFYHQKIDMWVHYRAFSRSWWIWLLLTGVGLGCAFSSKWVGIFTMATVGVSTLKHLWEILGDVRVTKVTKKNVRLALCNLCLILEVSCIIASILDSFHCKSGMSLHPAHLHLRGNILRSLCYSQKFRSWRHVHGDRDTE